MINLAQKDIAHGLGKFIITSMGVGMLLGIVLIMIGVYRGMIVDAEALLRDLNVDFWIVQEDTLGPFAEASRVHEDLQEALRVVEGIDSAEALTFQNIQLSTSANPVRVVAVGFDPHGSLDAVNPRKIIAGRTLLRSHYEIVVTDKTGFVVGETLQLGRNTFRVVGVTKGTVSSGGEPLVYISLKDAQELQFSYTNNRIRSDRARGIINRDSHMVNTIVATVKPGYNVDEIARQIRESKHKSVYTRVQQEKILTKNVIEKASKQIGMFTAILVAVSTIIIALIIYTMTLEKMREISIMKLIGLPNSMIIKMIVQETVLLGFLAFVFGNAFSLLIYDTFPKRVVLEFPDAWMLFLVVMVFSILSSFVGVKKVISADPAAAIGG